MKLYVWLTTIVLAVICWSSVSVKAQYGGSTSGVYSSRMPDYHTNPRLTDTMIRNSLERRRLERIRANGKSPSAESSPAARISALPASGISETSASRLSFTPSKKRIVPAMFAASMKTEQEKANFVSFAENGINAVEAKLREGGRPLYNIPEISTMLVRNAFLVCYGEEFTEHQRAGVLALFTDYYENDGEFHKLTDTDLQKLYESDAITMILMASEYDEKTKTFSEKAKQLARRAAEINLGNSIDKFKLTPDGIDFK